jgi:hypothetical protein
MPAIDTSAEEAVAEATRRIITRRQNSRPTAIDNSTAEDAVASAEAEAPPKKKQRYSWVRNN